MLFVVTSEGNNSTFGDLFFSLPTKEACNQAAEIVEQLCRKEPLPTQAHAERLEEELQRMRESQSACHFLLMKEIHDMSPSGIMLETDADSSVICQLLGITTTDGLNSSTQMEFIWGIQGQSKLPALSARIPAEIRPQIASQLRRNYGHLDTDDELFCRISLVDYHKPVLRYTVPPYTDALLVKALHTIAQEAAECAQGHFDENAIGEAEYLSQMNLAEEMLAMSTCDLPTLIRLYAYRLGNFKDKRQVARLQEPWFFTTRNEFYAMLLSLGMPKEEALEMVRRGVWSRGRGRAQFLERLIKYNPPAPLVENYMKTTNLWSAGSCLSRINFLLQTI